MKNKTVFLLLALCLSAVIPAPTWGGSDAPCPWKINEIEAGKDVKGNLKSSIRAHGSFPIPPGVSERPA